MAKYIEIGSELTFPVSSDANKMIFGVNSMNQGCLTNSSGITYNFGTGTTSFSYDTIDDVDALKGYTITGTGVYRIFRGTEAGNFLIFPNPSSFVGQTLIVMNSANDVVFLDSETGPWGSNNQYTELDKEKVYTFFSIGNKWRGTGKGFQT